MAEMADGEFWVPSKCTVVEERDAEEEEKKNHQMRSDGVHFPSEFPYAYEWNQGSPVESVAEIESGGDEEQRQHVVDLSRRTDRTSLCSAFDPCNQKVSMVGLLHSIRAMRRMSILSQGGYDGPSQFTALLSSLELQSNNEWGLLYDAAGQIVRLKRLEETGENGSSSVRGLLGPPKRTPTAADASTAGYHSHPVITQHQLQVTDFKQLKQRQQCSIGRGRQVNGRRGRGFGQGRATDWPWSSPQQQFQMGSGMTAVFLGGGAKESGTGVFLPRSAGGGPSEMQRKPACSTVLLPARVVQALNLDLDEIGAHLTHLDRDDIRARSAAMILQNKRQQRQQILRSQQAILRFNSESWVPHDWTY